MKRLTPKQLLNAINKACEIIEEGDRRLMHYEVVGSQPPNLTLKEWRELYRTLDAARRLK